MSSHAATPPVEMSCSELQAKLNAEHVPLLLDCREPEEYAVVRLESAVLLPMNDIASRLDELALYRHEEIIVYCHHGIRSRHVAAWLRQQGFARARSLSGGIDRWAAEIDPTLPRY